MQALEESQEFVGTIVFGRKNREMSIAKDILSSKGFSEVTPIAYPEEIGNSTILDAEHFDLLKNHVVRRQMNLSSKRSAFAFFDGAKEIQMESLELGAESALSLCQEIFGRAVLGKEKNELFPRISYNHALSLMKRETGIKCRLLGKKELFLLSKLFLQPFFVTEWPEERLDTEESARFKLIFNGEEVALGTERKCMNDYDKRILSELGYNWYLGGKKNDCGFGLSIDIEKLAKLPEKQKF